MKDVYSSLSSPVVAGTVVTFPVTVLHLTALHIYPQEPRGQGFKFPLLTCKEQ